MPAMQLGQEYADRKALDDILRADDVFRGTDSFVKKSDCKRWHACCNRMDCPFQVNAVVTKDSEAFKITTLFPHMCSADHANERKRTWLTSVDLAERLVHEVDLKVTRRDVRQRILRKSIHNASDKA